MDADGSEFFEENKIKKSSRCCNSCLLRGAYEYRPMLMYHIEYQLFITYINEVTTQMHYTKSKNNRFYAAKIY